ncbi:hypothetical protein TNCV_3083871 [Trichonephila clavipes]|nr:hypothetical protein TNCV_3083871 [Trichonephila clavipes]
MARVLQVHPSKDGLVRAATVKTKDSVFKRPAYKLHKLSRVIGREYVSYTPHLTVTECAIFSRLPSPTESLQPRAGTFCKQEAQRTDARFLSASIRKTFKGVNFFYPHYYFEV